MAEQEPVPAKARLVPLAPVDHYACVYDAVYAALGVESQASIDDAIASAINAFFEDDGADLE